MSENTPAITEALDKMQQAFKSLTLEEVKVVKELQKEVDAAAQAGSVPNPKLEFCYSVKFSQDRISNQQLLKACDAYIAAAEG